MSEKPFDDFTEQARTTPIQPVSLTNQSEQPGALLSLASEQGTSESPSLYIDATRQQKAVALARSRRKAARIYLYTLVFIIVAVIIVSSQNGMLLFWLISAVIALLTAPVLGWQPITGWWPVLTLLCFILILGLILLLILPLSWYSGFVLARRYGLRKDTTRDWLLATGKSFLVSLVPLSLFIELITLLIAVQSQTWWIWAALVQFLFSILMTRFSAQWLLPWLNRLAPLSKNEIAERLRVLLAQLHLPPCQVFEVRVSRRTDATNAFFFGWGGGRCVILTDTLIQSFTLDEIEVVLAHELGHLAHHDIWTRLIMRGLTVLGLLYLIYLALNSLAFPIPLVADILFLAFVYGTVRYRRYQEYQADEFALQATGKVQAFKDAMTRLTSTNMLVTTSKRGAKHPASHPTLLKRLRHADEFAARQRVPDTSIQI